MRTTPIREDELLAAWREVNLELGRQSADEVPRGWLSAKQWADETGSVQQHVKVKLDRAVKAGLAQCRVYRVLTRSGLRPIQHYRLKPKGKR